MNPEDEKKEDEIIVDDEEQQQLGEEQPDEQEIDLEDDAAKREREERDRNKAFASMRIENKKLQEQLAQVQEQIKSVATPRAPVQPEVSAGVPKTDEEWDALADKDWKKAVDLRSTLNAQNIVASQNQAVKAGKTLDESKQRVIARHPELNENTSEKTKIYLQILNENPDYLSNPKGPIYAMRDMEDYMENTLGYKRSEIVSAEKAGAQREASRQHRIILNKGGGHTNAGNPNKIVLSKDEMEFCKFQGLDPKEYARNKQKLSKSSAKEGVEI